MKKAILFLLAMMAVTCAAWHAQAEPLGPFSSDLPEEQRWVIEWEYEGCTIEDYLEMDTPEGRMALELIWYEGKRLLAVACSDGYQMFQQYVTAEAMPQDEGWAYLDTLDGETGFSVFFIDPEHEEYWMKMISFAWQDGTFRLREYMDRSVGCESVSVSDAQQLTFHDIGLDEDVGTVQAELITDIRWVSFENLPKTFKAGQKGADVPPGFCRARIRWDTLSADVVAFPSGHSYEVYMGPGKKYPRGANGKASVSTNGWVQVFATYNGFALIQYHIDGDHYRIGWIDASALPRGAAVPALTFADDDAQEITEDCVLTDDPLGSGEAVLALKAGTPVTNIAFLGAQWEFICVTVDGKTYWGFVPCVCMTHG